MSLKDKKLFLLDMDGTIYLDNELFDGTLEFLEYLKQTGRHYVFITNNSSKSVEKYIEKLDKLGIKSSAHNFLTSADAMCVYLKKKNYKKIYIIGTKSFSSQLEANNLPVTTSLEDDIDCLCMGFDTELSFNKIQDACILLNRDIDYVATNPDLVCPTAYGFAPDCGSIAQMLYTATKKQPKYIGKPQPEMIYMAMNKSGFSKNETVVIGDRLYTDVAAGANAQVDTVFVLSGEGTVDDLKKSYIKPSYVHNNIQDILDEIKC